MSQFYSSRPEPHHLLAASVRGLDEALSRRAPKQLALAQADSLLLQVEQFFQQAWQHQKSDAELPGEARMLLVAGCRLSSDLNETVLGRLIDQAQSQDAEIAQLSGQLARQLMARAQTGQLLKKAQRLKQHTVETAETAGLGVII
jgi:hypothetical protein